MVRSKEISSCHCCFSFVFISATKQLIRVNDLLPVYSGSRLPSLCEWSCNICVLTCRAKLCELRNHWTRHIKDVLFSMGTVSCCHCVRFCFYFNFHTLRRSPLTKYCLSSESFQFQILSDGTKNVMLQLHWKQLYSEGFGESAVRNENAGKRFQTKWIHALDSVHEVASDLSFHEWIHENENTGGNVRNLKALKFS